MNQNHRCAIGIRTVVAVHLDAALPRAEGLRPVPSGQPTISELRMRFLNDAVPATT